MSSVKEEVMAMIRQMPEDITVTDIMAELYFRQKVNSGLKELDEGKGIPHEEVTGRDFYRRSKTYLPEKLQEIGVV